jgi:hypothetical protein
MRQLALKLRALTVALALAIPLAGMRGVCFMSSGPSGTPRSEHECCKTGLKLAPPNCCIAVTWEQAAARTASRPLFATPAAFIIWALAPIDSSMTGERPVDPPRQHEHDPPEHIVLRI